MSESQDAYHTQQEKGTVLQTLLNYDKSKIIDNSLIQNQSYLFKSVSQLSKQQSNLNLNIVNAAIV